MPSPEPGSYALIVGADTYADKALGQLRSPTHDGRELSNVLSDPRIGGFSTHQLLNRPAYEVAEEIEGFFADRRANDLLVLHLSCHGVKDESGRLYFAMSSTKLDRLAATGLSAAFVNEQIDRSRSQKIVLLLDCCYSGAFPKNLIPRSPERMDLDRFQGRGRVVISSSTSLEYAYESDTRLMIGTGRPSVFTGVLVEGLRTGNADLDGDGAVSVDELYDYLFDHVRQITPHQTPEKISTVRGELIIARNPRLASHAELAPPGSADLRQDDTEDELAKARRVAEQLLSREQAQRQPNLFRRLSRSHKSREDVTVGERDVRSTLLGHRREVLGMVLLVLAGVLVPFPFAPISIFRIPVLVWAFAVLVVTICEGWESADKVRGTAAPILSYTIGGCLVAFFRARDDLSLVVDQFFAISGLMFMLGSAAGVFWLAYRLFNPATPVGRRNRRLN
ncbi:Caspase domain-containing protein [Streptosporangium subroseum]|uniref:Caspase domain-containing protein n=1 Tax=Streptosporangium subroseum TaxID=106412 RepID=A0A239P7X9_9ACTN|nr:caspase family protein [Streptosporangium subroseum]SNT62814.1 Caspase domain-containing protein [Streptosporangium subroseum]